MKNISAKLQKVLFPHWIMELKIDRTRGRGRERITTAEGPSLELNAHCCC